MSCFINWDIFLRLMEILLSWPVITLVLGLIFLIKFSTSISSFFSRVTRGEAYGIRVEAATPQQQHAEISENIASIPTDTDDDLDRRISTNPREFRELYIRIARGYIFERAFNVIYGTQIRLLEFLETKGEAGEKYINLVSFFTEFQNLSKMTNVQLGDYMKFLIDSGFIVRFGDVTDLSFRITPNGIDFLSYLRSQYPNVYRYRVW